MESTHKEERHILEAIRQGKAPAVVKRQASRGTIPVAAEELMEILVLLANDPDPTCSEAAKHTLASWPPEKCAALLADPEASPEALAHFAGQPQVPEAIVAAIAGHPHAGEAALAPLAARLSLDQVQRLAGNESRLEEMPLFVAGLLDRRDLPADLRRRLQGLHDAHQKAQAELAAALAREEEHEAKAKPEEKRERVSTTQKIARMSVGERMQCALKGTKDERLILIRDPSKVVYRAVLNCPKLTDSEVEAFASMKNVAEDALRIISTSRQFMKSYVVVRSLVNNPRTPIDVALGLLGRLNEQDLKFLGMNRNIPETVRTLATKLLKQKASARAPGGGH